MIINRHFWFFVVVVVCLFFLLLLKGNYILEAFSCFIALLFVIWGAREAFL